MNAEWQSTAVSAPGTGQPTFTPSLSDGYHVLKFTILRASKLINLNQDMVAAIFYGCLKYLAIARQFCNVQTLVCWAGRSGPVA